MSKSNLGCTANHFENCNNNIESLLVSLLVRAPFACICTAFPFPLSVMALRLAHILFAIGQVSKAAVALQLQESWLREQQVLPGRTHPHMTMSTTGGYILSGIKVLPD